MVDEMLERAAEETNCIGGYDLLKYNLDVDEICDYMRDVDNCLFDGGYYDKDITKWEIVDEEGKIKIYVNDKKEKGKYYIQYDRSVNHFRLYPSGY